MHELRTDRYPIVRPLLSTMEQMLSAFAVVDGTCPGEVWVDGPSTPRLALLSTPEGHALAGDRAGVERSLDRALDTGTDR